MFGRTKDKTKKRGGGTFADMYGTKPTEEFEADLDNLDPRNHDEHEGAKSLASWVALGPLGPGLYLANKGLDRLDENRRQKHQADEFARARYAEATLASLTRGDFESLAKVWPDAYEAVLALARDQAAGRVHPASSKNDLSLADLVRESEKERAKESHDCVVAKV